MSEIYKASIKRMSYIFYYNKEGKPILLDESIAFEGTKYFNYYEDAKRFIYTIEHQQSRFPPKDELEYIVKKFPHLKNLPGVHLRYNEVTINSAIDIIVVY